MLKSGVDKITLCGASQFVLFTKYYQGDKIKEGDIGKAYGTRGKDEKQTDGVGGGYLEERTTCKIQEQMEGWW